MVYGSDSGSPRSFRICYRIVVADTKRTEMGVRVLFTCAAGSWQHLHCLLPLAGAARVAGDKVAVASGPDRAHAVAAAGFEFLPVGLGFDDQVRLCAQRFP